MRGKAGIPEGWLGGLLCREKIYVLKFPEKRYSVGGLKTFRSLDVAGKTAQRVRRRKGVKIR